MEPHHAALNRGVGLHFGSRISLKNQPYYPCGVGPTRLRSGPRRRELAFALALGREFLVDQLLEALVGLRAAQAPAVHEERRSGVDAEGRRLALVGLDGVERFLALQALLELGDVEAAGLADLRRLGGEVVLVDLALLGEEAVVHGPELIVALLKGALRGDGGILGPRMNARERVILENEADLVAVLLDHLGLERGVDAAAERALKIRILDDRHLRVRRTARRLAVELDLVPHLLQRIDGQIHRVAAEEIAAVAAHVEGDVLGLLAEGNLEVALPPARDLRVLDLRHLEGEAGGRDGLLEVVDDALGDRRVVRGGTASAAASSPPA